MEKKRNFLKKEVFSWYGQSIIWDKTLSTNAVLLILKNAIREESYLLYL